MFTRKSISEISGLILFYNIGLMVLLPSGSHGLMVTLVITMAFLERVTV